MPDEIFATIDDENPALVSARTPDTFFMFTVDKPFHLLCADLS
jgi:hypothetical protein